MNYFEEMSAIYNTQLWEVERAKKVWDRDQDAGADEYLKNRGFTAYDYWNNTRESHRKKIVVSEEYAELHQYVITRQFWADIRGRQEANQLLKQAESNEIWATLQPKRKANQLNKVAKQMRTEAMRIMDEVTGFDAGDCQDLSDSELLDALLGE